MSEIDAPARPGIRVPPPLLFLLGLGIGTALDRWFEALPIFRGEDSGNALRMVGWVVAVIGIALIIWAIRTFRQARTAVLPFSPASTIVEKGPYVFSRNPMYVGMTLFYIGITLAANTVWPLFLLPFVIGALHFAVITKEERYLAAAFTEEYESYRGRVRRWI